MVSAPVRMANAWLTLVSSMVLLAVLLADARQFVRQVALAPAEVHRREERHGQRRRQEGRPTEAALLHPHTGRRTSLERDHFPRPFDSLHTDLAVAIQVRADLAALRFFGHAVDVEFVMFAQFVAVHVGTTAPGLSRVSLYIPSADAIKI